VSTIAVTEGQPFQYQPLDGLGRIGEETEEAKAWRAFSLEEL
jgi:hypothetical protein